ncbi:MAG TPA: NUDIX hydrolase [Gammaproteobacteria bacterium]|nr:NUDIX hydrolase [Gammaproteobacteria bacterium]
MPYTCDHPHPAVTTDVVLFARDRRQLKVLLIQRAYDPYAGCWALPGGFLDAGEDLIDCALRELLEETGIHAPMLQQLHAFGRADRDPRERVITVAYYGLLPGGPVEPRAGSDADAARWHDLKRLPPLAFDHRDIIQMAVARLGKNPPPPGQSKVGGNAKRRQAAGPRSKVGAKRSKQRHSQRR